MDVTCPRCRMRHHVDPPPAGRARSRPLRFRCSDCGHTFPLVSESADGALPAAAEPPSRSLTEPLPVAQGERVEQVRVAGEVYDVADLATLQRWVLEGRVDPADEVCEPGNRWTTLGDRPDFHLFFVAASALGVPRDAPMTAFVEAPTAPEHDPFAPPAEFFLGDRPRGVPPRLDSLPPSLLGPRDEDRAKDESAALQAAPDPLPVQAEPRFIGFQLGSDTDPQEATVEEVRPVELDIAPIPLGGQSPPSRGDLADDFMLAGVLPESAPPTLPPDFGDGPVPVTVVPRLPRSVLDDDPYEEPVRVGRGPEWMIGGALGLAVLLAFGGWLFAGPEGEPEREKAASASAEAGAEVVAAPVEAAKLEAEIAADEAELSAPVEEAVAKPVPPPKPAVAAVPPPVPKPVAAPKPAVAAPKPAVAAVPRPAPKPAVAAPKPAETGGSAKSLTAQGWKAMDDGDANAAHGFFARALQKSPGSAGALYGRGYANERLGDKGSAKSDYCSASAKAGADTELVRELESGLRRVGGPC